MVTGLPVADLETATRTVVALQRTGTRCIILTLGEKGLLYARLSAATKEWSPIKHIKAEKVDVVDTTVRETQDRLCIYTPLQKSLFACSPGIL